MKDVIIKQGQSITFLDLPEYILKHDYSKRKSINQVCNLIKLLIRAPTANATSARMFTALKRFKVCLRNCRSSHQRCSLRKGVIRNFAKFTGKHLCQSLFFYKVAGQGLRPASLLKKRLWHRCFPVDFAKFLRTPFSQNTLRRLLPELVRKRATRSVNSTSCLMR